MNVGKQIKEGLLTRNPAAVQLLGLCGALAVTTSLLNGLGMGLCVTVVLVLSNVLLSALAQYIPSRIRVVSAIVVTATLGAMTDLVVQAFFPKLAGELGLFLPLTAVIGVLLNHGGTFAYKNTVGSSAAEGICQGLGYTLVLVLVSVIREFLGKGSFGAGLINGGQGLQVFPVRFAVGGMALPVGGFLALACVVAILQSIGNKPQRSKKKKGVEKG